MTEINSTILSASNLSKKFIKANGDEFIAVNDITFTLKRGEIFSFLGPNGAGKSTTIGMLTGQKKLSGGSITIDGKSITDHASELKAQIGVVTQHNNLDRGLTARENLIYHGLYFGMSLHEVTNRADELLEKFGLSDWKNDFVKSFSGGMVQRLKIARAMVHKPSILFLDEPTTGLDPQYREILWEQMLNLNKEGTTVFLTTHYMEEPERFSDRIAIFAKGEIKAIGTTNELKSMIPGHRIATLGSSDLTDSLVEELKKESFVKSINKENGKVVVYLENDEDSNISLITWLSSKSINFDNLNVTNATLDDVFIYLTSDKEAKHD